MYMNWFYFKIKIVKFVKNLLLNEINEDNAVKCILLPNLTIANELYYTAITNIQMTLNKNSIFEVHNNLGINIGGR